MAKLRDLKGQKFHKLLVIERAASNRAGGATWLCKCDCGKEKVYSSDHITRKKSPVKSCGCSAKIQGSEHPLWTGHGEISGHWWYNHVLRERKQNDRIRVPVDVTIEFAWELFLKQDRKCALSGLELTVGNNRYSDASIDRVDSSKGYTEENIQWVHKHINFMKRTYSQEYFIKMCKLVAENLEEAKAPSPEAAK